MTQNASKCSHGLQPWDTLHWLHAHHVCHALKGPGSQPKQSLGIKGIPPPKAFNSMCFEGKKERFCSFSISGDEIQHTPYYTVTTPRPYHCRDINIVCTACLRSLLQHFYFLLRGCHLCCGLACLLLRVTVLSCHHQGCWFLPPREEMIALYSHYYLKQS